MTGFVFWLLAIFAIEPLYFDYGDRLAISGASAETMAQIEACRDVAGEVYAERVGESLWWGVRSTVRVLIGTQTPGELLGEVVPNCAEAFRTADEIIATVS